MVGHAEVHRRHREGHRHAQVALAGVGEHIVHLHAFFAEQQRFAVHADVGLMQQADGAIVVAETAVIGLCSTAGTQCQHTQPDGKRHCTHEVILERPAYPRAGPHSMPRAGSTEWWAARRATGAAMAQGLMCLWCCRACWWRWPGLRISLHARRRTSTVHMRSLALVAVLLWGPLSVLGDLNAPVHSQRHPGLPYACPRQCCMHASMAR